MARLGLDFPTSWSRAWIARVVRSVVHGAFLAPYMRYLATLEVRGLENLPVGTPLVFAANHTSNLDTPLLLSALPARVRRRTVVAAAMDSFFMTRLKAARTVLVFNAIPIDRHRVNRRSAQIAQGLLEEGWNLLIYPEGGRSPTGELHEFKGGAAYLAERTGAIIIPTYIHDAAWLRGPKYAKAPRFTSAPSRRRNHVIVAFGVPVRAGEGESVRRLGARIESAVAELGRAVSGDPNYGLRPPSP